MRFVPLLALVSACSSSCSGDGSTKTPKTPTTVLAHADAGSGSGSAEVLPANAVPLSESAAQSHWTTPDEIEASTKFSLEEYAAAAKAWTKARAATKDADKQARIDLMLGLCAERSNDAATTACAIQAIVSGALPAPAPSAAQVACLLRVLDALGAPVEAVPARVAAQ